MSDKPSGRPVVITTGYRGVFYGYADNTSGDVVVLRNARNCIYWSAKTGGFMGLASHGPKDGSRIGATVKQIELRKVTSVLEAEPAAVAAWESADVYAG